MDHGQAFTNVQLKGKKSKGGHRRGIYERSSQGGQSTHLMHMFDKRDKFCHISYHKFEDRFGRRMMMGMGIRTFEVVIAVVLVVILTATATVVIVIVVGVIVVVKVVVVAIAIILISTIVIIAMPQQQGLKFV